MWLEMFIGFAWISKVHLQAQANLSRTYYHVATRYSSVSLSGWNIELLSEPKLVYWLSLSRSYFTTVLSHELSSSKIKIYEFFGHRLKYSELNGSLEIFNLDLNDHGTYELHIIRQFEFVPGLILRHFLEVQEILPQPLIIFDIIHELRVVHLNCFVKYGEVNAIWWLQEGGALQNDEIYEMSNHNRTLIINIQHLMNCKLYTCVIRNKVSQKDNSHLLVIDGWMFIHKLSLVTSVMALVSTFTSFAACCPIIFCALRLYRVRKRHVELTAVFMLFQMLSFFFMFIAAIFCMIDSVYPEPYRIIEGVGFFLILVTIVYIVYLYLRPENRLKYSFLIKKNHQYIFLAYGIFSMLISALPIHRGQENITECQVPLSHVSGTIAVAVIVYLFVVGLLFIIFFKYMLSWPKFQRLTTTSR